MPTSEIESFYIPVGEMLMKFFVHSIFFLLFAVPLIAQTQGVVDCHGEPGIPAWEKPGTVVEIRHLSCGENIKVLGSEGDYVKIAISENLAGYVKAKYVRFVDDSTVSSSPNIRKSRAQQEFPNSSEIQGVIPTQTPTPHPKSSGKRTLGIELGIEISPIRFKQFTSYAEIYKQLNMEESGSMVGLYGTYGFRHGNYRLKLDGMFSLGTVDYSVPDPTYPVKVPNISNFITEPRATFERSFPISERVYLMPFTGFGYRFRYDGMGGKQGIFGVIYSDRKTHYFYSPFGGEAGFSIGKNWALKISGEYDLFWRGLHYNEYSDVNPDAQISECIQSSGWGLRGSIGISKRIGKLQFGVAPFFRYWSIKASDMSEGNWDIEPDNQTREWGTRLGVRF